MSSSSHTITSYAFLIASQFLFLLRVPVSYGAIDLRVLEASTYVVRLGSYFLHGVDLASAVSRESFVVG